MSADDGSAAQDPIARRLLVSGDVQGVGFRAGCRDAALEFGVLGTVRNRSDGRVEVVGRGSRQDVGRLVDWCRHGPSGAEVNDLDIEELDPASVTTEDFHVVH